MLPLTPRLFSLAAAALCAAISLGPSRPVAAQTETTMAAPSVTPAQYVDQALGVIERNSFYADKVDMAAIRFRAMDKATGVASITDAYPIIDEAIKATGDKHALFRPPATQVLITQGKNQGYGFVAVWPSRLVVILATGGPAERAGMKLGDRIEQVSGGPVAHTTWEVSFQKDAAGALPAQVALTLSRRKRKITVTISKGDVSTVNAPTAQAAPTPPGSRLAGKVGYIDVPGIVGDAGAQSSFAQQTQALLADLDPAARCGWVIDLRRNKGGYTAAMLAGVAPLLPAGELARRVLADGSQVAFTYQNGELRQGANLELGVTPAPSVVRTGRPVAVLTSALTASAAEATTLAFLGRPSTRVFGEPTYGLTSYTILSVLHDGASLTVTNALDLDAVGRTHDGPIIPDESVAVNWAQLATPTDPVLIAALRWLGRQPSCT